jgi:hypothetical protein
MEKSQKTRKMISLSAGAAVGLSATAIVTLKEQGTSNERLSIIQSVLRDGIAIANGSADTPVRIRVAVNDRG